MNQTLKAGSSSPGVCKVVPSLAKYAAMHFLGCSCVLVPIYVGFLTVEWVILSSDLYTQHSWIFLCAGTQILWIFHFLAISFLDFQQCPGTHMI